MYVSRDRARKSAHSCLSFSDGLFILYHTGFCSINVCDAIIMFILVWLYF